jgi:transcriptional regulator with XRE-family HTH domain
VSKSTISGWKKGATPRAGIVKSIADYFDVSPEYIANGNKAPVTNADAICVPRDSDPVAVINGKKRKLSEQEVAVLQLCKELDVVQKAKLLAYASELES